MICFLITNGRNITGYFLFFISFAGTPATTEKGSTLSLTTAPAATMDPIPMVTPCSMVTPPPIQQSDSMWIGAEEMP